MTAWLLQKANLKKKYLRQTTQVILLALFWISLITKNAHAAGFAANYGGLIGGNERAYSFVSDSAGNSYFTGYFDATTATFGGVTLTRIGLQDAFVVKLDSTGTVLWAKNFGGSGATVYGQSIAVDGSGNVYLGGYFQSASLTTPALAKIGTQDAFAIKLDSSGTTTWSKNFGGSGGATVYGQSIAVDGSGNVYLGGYFQSASLTTPSLTKKGTRDAFAIKLNSSGTASWSKNYGGAGAAAYGQSIAVDGTGNVYLGGYFQSANLTTPALTKIGTSDCFAMKLDSSGNTTWSKNYGGAGAATYEKSIAVDGTGNVYLGGFFQSANLTTPALTKIGNLDAFAIKLDSSGSTTWSKNFGGSAAAAYEQILAIDGSGNVYLGGYFGGANLTTPALTKIGTSDCFAMKLDSSGNITWSKNFGGLTAGGASTIIAVVKDNTGNIYLTGSFTANQFNLGAVALLQIGTGDVFVAKLNSVGTVLWAKNFGGAGAAAYGQSIAVDGTGNVYLGGYFQSANLTTPALTKIGTSDAFAIKLDSSGNTTWSKNYGGAGVTTYGQSIAVDGSGNVYLSGSFQSASLTTPALTKIGNSDAFAIKLDSSGNTTWSKNYGGAGAAAYGKSIAVDGSGNVYLSGSFNTANLTTPSLTLIGAQDAFAMKLDSSGNTMWSKNYGGAGVSADGLSIAFDGSGNVYLIGSFNTANLTTPSLTLIGASDGFAMKLDSSGNTTWSKNFGGSGASVNPTGMAVDGTGNVYLGGYFGGANLTTPSLTLIGAQDAFAIKLGSTSGNITWSKNFGGSGALTYEQSIAVDGTGNVYLAGSFISGNLTTPALTQIGAQDAFIVDTQLFNTACTTSGKVKFDTTNNVMVYCDGSLWQSMNNTSSANCTGAATGKIKYYSSGASSDFVWYGSSCRSSKSSTTYGACAVNGKLVWDSVNSTIKGCVNGTWMSLRGY